MTDRRVGCPKQSQFFNCSIVEEGGTTMSMIISSRKGLHPETFKAVTVKITAGELMSGIGH